MCVKRSSLNHFEIEARRVVGPEGLEIEYYRDFSLKSYFLPGKGFHVLQRRVVSPYVVLDCFEIGCFEYVCFCCLEMVALIENIRGVGGSRIVAELLHSVRGIDIYCVSQGTIARVNAMFDLSLSETEKNAEARCELASLMSVMKKEHPLLRNEDGDSQDDCVMGFGRFVELVFPSVMMFFIRRFYYSPRCFGVEKLHHFGENRKEFKPSGFVVLRRLGSGGRGNVDLCFDKEYGDLFALKSYVGDRKVSGHNFRREYSSLTRFSHPCILKVFGYLRRSVIAQVDAGICTEFLANGCLRSVLDLEKQGKAPNEWNYIAKLKTLYGVLAALSELHNKGYMHRDLKTLNVLLNSDFEPCLSDMDSCKEYGTGDNTQDIGTLIYEAPEQIDGKDYTFYSDLYAFGVFIYEVITGNHMFPDSASYQEVRERILKGKFPEMPKGIGKSICEVYSDLLQVNPNKRINVKLIESRFKADPYFRTAQMEAYIRRVQPQDTEGEERSDLQAIRQEALDGSDSALFQLTLLVITNSNLARYSIGDPYDMLKLCSNLGNNQFTRIYGEMLATGKGIAKDERKGIKITWKLSQNTQEPDVTNIFLGRYFLKSRLSGYKALAEGVRLLKKSTFADPGCYHDLYLCYLHGVGVPAKVEKALKYLQKGTSYGSRKCCRTLSKVYLTGDILEKDIERALYYASMGYSRAKSAERHVTLGKIYDESRSLANANQLAKEHFSKAGQLGSLEGKARLLAIRIRLGEDRCACMRELHKLAKTGDPFCCYQYADLLRLQAGNEQTARRVVKYFRKATLGDIPEAHFELGFYLAHGIGCSVDFPGAQACFAWKSYIRMPGKVSCYAVLFNDIQMRISMALKGLIFGDPCCYEVLYDSMMELRCEKGASIFLKLGCSYGIPYCLTELAIRYTRKHSLTYHKALPLLEYASDHGNRIAQAILGAVYFANATTPAELRKAERLTRILYDVRPYDVPKVSMEILIHNRLAVLSELFDELKDVSEFFELAQRQVQIGGPCDTEMVLTLMGRVLVEGNRGVAKNIEAGVAILLNQADKGIEEALTCIWNLPASTWSNEVWKMACVRADSGSLGACAILVRRSLDLIAPSIPYSSITPLTVKDRNFSPEARDLVKYAEMLAKSQALRGPVCQVLYKCYSCGIGTMVDMHRALEYCQKAVDENVVSLIYELARFYEKGHYVRQSLSHARFLYEMIIQKNIEGHISKAMWRLAGFYSTGLGGPEETEKALQYAQILATMGKPKAAELAGMLIVCKLKGRSRSQGFEYLHCAAEAGIPHAMTYTGAMLLGGIGTKKNTLTGLYWIQEATRHGDPDACILMAQLKYASTRNFNEISCLIKTACNGGNMSALLLYTIMLWRGLGVAQDIESALENIPKLLAAQFYMRDIVPLLTGEIDFPIAKFTLPGLGT